MANKLLSNFSGGQNNKAAPLILQDSQCELILNYNLDEVGALTKRNGYTVYATQPVAGKRVHGLFQYTNTATAAETTQVMVVNNSGDTNAVIYYNNSGTWSTSKTDDTAVATFTNFNRARFRTFLDYLFRVNGVQVVATSVNVNGSTWGTTNAPGTITPSFIEIFQDRVYMARNGTAAASRVYFSQLPVAGAISWSITNDFFDVNPDDGDEITALENNGNRLLIFKRYSMYRWLFGQVEPDRLIGVGTESQECVKTNFDLGITFFANQKGAYAYTGQRPKLISRKIQRWFDAVPAADVNDMCAEVDADHYYLYLSDSLTIDNRTYTNVVAVYTVSLDAWTLYSLHTPVRTMARLIDTSAEGIYFGSSNGRTYFFNDGQTDNSAGADGNTATNINGEIITKDVLLSFPTKTKLNYVDVVSREAPTVSVFYDLDRSRQNENFLPLGNLKTRFNMALGGHIGAEGRSVRLRISDSGVTTSVIEMINIEHSPQEDRK